MSGVSHLPLSSDPEDFDASGLCLHMLIHKHIIKNNKQIIDIQILLKPRDKCMSGIAMFSYKNICEACKL